MINQSTNEPTEEPTKQAIKQSGNQIIKNQPTEFCFISCLVILCKSQLMCLISWQQMEIITLTFQVTLTVKI